MKKFRKRIFVLIMILLIMFSLVLFKINYDKVKTDKGLKSKESKKQVHIMQELYDYGEYLETLDLAPNTIVAKIDGEEILFHQVTWILNQEEYAKENGNSNLKEDKDELMNFLIDFTSPQK